MNSRLWLPLFATAALAGCAATPAARPVSEGPYEPLADARVFFYPLQGQDAARQDRDRYDCHYWAVRQTGFDPARRIVPSQARASVIPVRAPAEAALAGAVTGAVVGAAVAGPGHTGEGAAVGAVAGAVLGTAAAQNESARLRPVSRSRENFEQRSAGFRRAMSACLEGRGYSVK